MRQLVSSLPFSNVLHPFDFIAAFFRRAVAQRLKFTCRQSAAACTPDRLHRNRWCAACRFNTCVRAGMLIDLVAPNGGRLLADDDGTPLGAVRLALRATYVDRRFHLQQMFGQTVDPREQWLAEGSNSRWFRAVRAEAPTLREFLRSVRFFGAPDEDVVCSQTFFLWIMFEMIANTRAHGGHQTRRLYYVDSSSVHVNEDRLFDFYRPNQQLMNPDLIARHALALFEEVLHAAEVMERVWVDETERAAITIVCLINKLRRARITAPHAAEWLDRTFRNLRTHYEQTSRVLSTRLGQLLLCIEAIEEAHVKQAEFYTLVQLNYRVENVDYRCYRGEIFKNDR